MRKGGVSRPYRYGAAVAATVLAVAAAWICAVAGRFFNPTDYGAWKGDWSALRNCLESVDASACAGFSKFPLAYLANASWAGGNERSLLWVNLLVLVLPVLCVVALRGWQTALRVGSVYALAIALSPLPLYYLNSGALEVQAGVFAGIYMAAVSSLLFQERPSKALLLILVVSGVVFPLYKDTVAALIGASVVAVMGCSAVLALRQGRPALAAKWRALAVFAVLPVVVSLALVVSYNVVKYSVPWPHGYLEEARQTAPGLKKSMEFFFGSVFSPNGGVVVFWFLPMLVAAVGWFAMGFVPSRTTLALATIAALLSCLMFARWWAPFGWDSWGDRLMIQPILAVVVAALLSLELRPPVRVAPVAWLVAGLLSTPALVWSGYYAAVPYLAGPGAALGPSLWSGPACEQMRQGLQNEAPSLGMAFWKTDTYYRCARERMLHVPSVSQ